MKRILFIIALATSISASAQERYFTRGASVSFFADGSNTPEKIEAHNGQGTSVFDAKTGQFEFAVLMKAFEFEKALMQDHFHENYVESEKFPKSNFKGNVVDMSKVDLTKDGSYPVKLKGNLTLHGVTKEVLTDAVFTVKGGKVNGSSTFKILLADYKVEIPNLVKDKISKDVRIVVDANYTKM